MERATCILLVVTVAASAGVVNSQETAVFNSKEISLAYDKRHYNEAKVVVLPKATGRATPEAAAGPKRFEIALRHQPRSRWEGAARYYYPSHSAIYVTPLFDPSVKDFPAAYPSLHSNALDLRKLLLLTPREFNAQADRRSKDGEALDLPDEPFSNTGACLLAHYKRLSHPRCAGYRVLTYYRNSIAGYGATNTELHYQYQGLTTDQRYFVTARIAVRHDRLPDSIDDPRAASDETEAEQRAERKRINRWKEDTFFPPLPALDAMVGSIQVNL